MRGGGGRGGYFPGRQSKWTPTARSTSKTAPRLSIQPQATCGADERKITDPQTGKHRRTTYRLTIEEARARYMDRELVPNSAEVRESAR